MKPKKLIGLVMLLAGLAFLVVGLVLSDAATFISWFGLDLQLYNQLIGYQPIFLVAGAVLAVIGLFLPKYGLLKK